MATLLLRAAGTALGGMFGPIGAAIGSAIGATAGYMVDQRLLGSNSVERGRMASSQPMLADEGHPVPLAYGYTRLSGTVIWATRLVETSETSRSGGKGGPSVTIYSYAANVAVAICEGPVAMIKRIWADGKEIDRRDIAMRLYYGHDSQQVDPLIAAKQGAGNAPAYKDIAYVVFEDLALERFGNRVPQFEFEVVKPVGSLEPTIKAMCLIPGATEYGLATSPVMRSVVTERPGTTDDRLDDGLATGSINEGGANRADRPVSNQPVSGTEVNRHILYGDTDFEASLDELIAVCPNLRNVSLVVPWFGDDLRAGNCRLSPGVVENDAERHSSAWQVAGHGRMSGAVHLISKENGRSNYGGTPSDQTVIEAIAMLKARGLGVTLNPFVMMDVPAGNTLPDPWGAATQGTYPWRGRITCHPAPLQPSSVDGTQAARDQVTAFLDGAVTFEPYDGRGFDGGDDSQELLVAPGSSLGYRAFILHCARLAVDAGGVDTLLLGSEMRSLTRVRDEAGRFPFVDGLCALAYDVRAFVGPNTKLCYGADWTEYGAYVPSDGSGDVYFPLDTLWAHSELDAIGIDSYLPLSDWRDQDAVSATGNPDGVRTPYDANAMREALTSGEGYDWSYASAADRFHRQRTPITDEAYGKPWTYRVKDLANWWSNHHVERRAGIEQPTATAWVPGSKPIWLTETGCPAIDKGANQPNVFADPKSSENAWPYHSSGARDDAIQRVYLQAMIDAVSHDFSFNPASALSIGRMIDPERVYAWAWDMRPYPAFPVTKSVWGDGDNWLRGHWLNGRLGTVPDGDLVRTISADHGLAVSDHRVVSAVFQGCHFATSVTGRAMIESIIEVSGLTISDSWTIQFDALAVNISEARLPVTIASLDLVDDQDGPIITRTRAQREDLITQLSLVHRDGLQDYHRIATVSSRQDTDPGNIEAIDTVFHMDEMQAFRVAERFVVQQWQGREAMTISLPFDHAALEPGDTFALDDVPDELWEINRTELSTSLKVSATRLPDLQVTEKPPMLTGKQAEPGATGQFGGPPWATFWDLPMWGSGDPTDQFRLAFVGEPAKTYAAVASHTDDYFRQRSTHRGNATLGWLEDDLLPGHMSGRMDRAGAISVRLVSGALESTDLIAMLSGRNALAIETRAGGVEIVQFQFAVETAPDQWQIEGLLRGQAGTEDQMTAGAAAGSLIVLLDGNISPAGLLEGDAGLPLHWRVGRANKEIGDRYFSHNVVTGGMRAKLPLSPVHLRWRTQSDGSLAFSWMRRDRVDADNWALVDIPHSEAAESYLFEIAGVTGHRISQTVLENKVMIPGSDLPALGASAVVTIQQVSATLGPGLAASATLTLNNP